MDEGTLSELLEATAGRPIEVELPSAGRVSVPVLRRIETRAGIEVPRAATCWAPNKPGLLFNGRTTWAEFILVALLEAAGWDARWVRNWSGGRQFCSEVGELRRLSGHGEAVFEAIHASAPDLRGHGTWDVIAWKDDQVLFLESKQARSSDRLRDSQLRFMDAALVLGTRPDAFAVVEYDAGPPLAQSTTQPRVPSARDPSPRRATKAPPSSDPELVRLIEDAAMADLTERISHRDSIAAYGSAAIAPMEQWVDAGRGPGFAIAVLEAIGRTSDATAALKALRRIRATQPEWQTVVEPAIARVEALRRGASKRRAGAS